MKRRGPPDMSQAERVLLIKLSSIGDVVHALPVSAALGEAFPHLKLTWIVEERASSLVMGNPYLHDVIVLPDDWHRPIYSPAKLRQFAELKRRLRTRHFDVSLDLQGLSRSAAIAWASGARYRYGYDWQREIAPLVNTRVQRRPGSTHMVDQLLDVVRYLGTPVRAIRFPLPCSPGDASVADSLLESVGIGRAQPFLVLNPTDGGQAHKGWGAPRLIALLNALPNYSSLPVLLVGGKQDLSIGAALMAEAKPRPTSLIGRTSLLQLVAVLRRASLHLSGDTGSAHIAAALGTPTIAIFGKTNPLRAAPYGQQHHVLHRPDTCGRACRWFHRLAPLNRNSYCFASSPKCLASIVPAEAAEMVNRCLAQTAPGSRSEEFTL